MASWFNAQSQPSEPSHGQIYERMENMNEDLQKVKNEAGKIYDTLHHIDRTMVRLESIIDERGRQLVATEQTLITHGKEINDLRTQVHTLMERGRQSGSIFKDYIFPVLLCVIPFVAMSIVGLLIFQAKMESTPPGPAMEQRRQ